MKAPIPILRSFNEVRAKEFYLEFLGFELVFEHRFEPEAPLYMGVRLGGCILHISEHYGDASPGATLRIQVDDIEHYCRQLNAKRFQNARPGIQNQPWGRDMTISDPSSNKLIFTDVD